jgi:hypothetical protein
MGINEMFNDRNVQKKIHNIGAADITNRRDIPNPDTDKVISAMEELIADLRKNPDTEYLLVRKVSKKELPPDKRFMANGANVKNVNSILTNGSDRFLLGTLIGLGKMKFGVDLQDVLYGEE